MSKKNEDESEFHSIMDPMDTMGIMGQNRLLLFMPPLNEGRYYCSSSEPMSMCGNGDCRVIASVRLTVQEEFHVTFREIFPNSLFPHTGVSVC